MFKTAPNKLKEPVKIDDLNTQEMLLAHHINVKTATYINIPKQWKMARRRCCWHFWIVWHDMWSRWFFPTSSNALSVTC